MLVYACDVLLQIMGSNFCKCNTMEKIKFQNTLLLNPSLPTHKEIMPRNKGKHTYMELSEITLFSSFYI